MKTKNMSLAITIIGFLLMIWGLILMSKHREVDFDVNNNDKVAIACHYYFGVGTVIVNVYTKNESFKKTYPFLYGKVGDFDSLGRAKTNTLIEELGLDKTEELTKLLAN